MFSIALDYLTDFGCVTQMGFAQVQTGIGIFMTEPLIYFVGLAFVGAIFTIGKKLLRPKQR